MPERSNDALKREVEAVFGAVLTDAEIEAGKGRLPTMLENARLLAGWAGRLNTTCPAQVLEIIEAPTPKADGDD